jgi:hypothetical protein
MVYRRRMMERLMKFLGFVVIMLVVSSTANAATAFYGSPGDWTDTGCGSYYPTAVPVASLGDYVYMYADTPTDPLVITAGTTAEADFLHLDAWGIKSNALEVNGSFSTQDAMTWNNLLFGPWNGAGTAGIVTINDGGSIDTGELGVYNPAAGGTTGGDYDVVLNGGTLTADSLRYNADDGFFITITIADYDAALICPQADFDAVNALAAGGVVGADTIKMEDLGGGMGKYTIVPEPVTMVLLGLGALVLRRKR